MVLSIGSFGVVLSDWAVRFLVLSVVLSNWEFWLWYC